MDYKYTEFEELWDDLVNGIQNGELGYIGHNIKETKIEGDQIYYGVMRLDGQHTLGAESQIDEEHYRELTGKENIGYKIISKYRDAEGDETEDYDIITEVEVRVFPFERGE